jgi:hypothetical protein
MKKLIELVVAVLIGSLLEWWYNHVLTVYQIPYWKWIFLATVFVILSKMFGEWHGKMWRVIFAICLLGQVCSWLHLCKLPLELYFR